MATPERHQVRLIPPDTVPKELIDHYQNLLNKIFYEYIPTRYYIKSSSSSGVYLNSKDGGHHISFHTTVKIDKNKILPRRIHVRYENGYIIHLKLIIGAGNIIQLVPKEESVRDFETYIKPSYIFSELENINRFLSSINLKGRLIDKSQKPPPLDFGDLEQFPKLNKYLEYKLKYFILKSLFEK